MASEQDTIVAPQSNHEEACFATIHGEPITKLPRDLYIPPDALEVFLEAFAGPLDLLLYLIKRQNLNILDIPIAEITRQYMEYVELIRGLRLELAADYLVMAAVLAEIKSRMLLPRPVAAEEEDDPRAELVRRLQEYERFSRAAQDIDDLPRINRDVFPVKVDSPGLTLVKKLPNIEIQDILIALKDVMHRAEMFAHHHVKREALSVRERMSQMLGKLQGEGFTEFTGLFTLEEGRAGVVVTFLAMLQLQREALIELVQNELYGPIYIRAFGACH